ncbi:MAG: NADH-quinone oxidoreductase subunit NuoG [Halieaceae bacterium]|jgi:NADH-quinone oxidoreductase subunit G|nr:NADH-quinone oxidoreductase subunit NuoG [Halieaceae bacterium]
MPTIVIDGEPYDVDGDKNLLETCLQLDKDLPYFCWHPAMGSVGSCRQCAVTQYQDENDERGRMVMSCMTPITDGMIVSLKDEATQEFRDSCIETVMTNHPHDCPVCEEGGECHLQDMTNMSGHTQRVYQGPKRTHRNQDLGPFINHEMNRCIACYRCVRYYQDYVGDTDLQAQGSGAKVFFGRHKDGALESEFSGNLVEVCPTGVFTDKTFSKHFVRKWDLQSAPSVCMHCAIGCNTSPGERNGTLRRIVNRYNGDVNGYFLCDRGRFGYDFVNDQRRLAEPLVQQGDSLDSTDRDDALAQYANLSADCEVIGIGSPRASLEANFALQQLVGEDNFYSGLASSEQALHQTSLTVLESTSALIASLRQVEQADAVLVLGEDILNTAPRLALAVKQATKNLGLNMAADARIPSWQAAAVKNLAQNQRSPLFMLTPAATRMDSIAQSCHNDVPANLARLGMAIANAIDGGAPGVNDLDDQEKELVAVIAETLKGASKPLVISGSGCFDVAVVQAAANISRALAAENDKAAIHLVLPEVNSLGLAMLCSKKPEADLNAAMKRTVDQVNGQAAVVVLENDLYRRAGKGLVDDFFDAAQSVVVIDSFHNDTTARAQLALPAATFAESEGTMVSSEARAQRYFAVHNTEGYVASSWKWLAELNKSVSWTHLDQLTAACANSSPLLAGITLAAPDREFRLNDQKVARQSHRYSGRGSATAHISVNETRVAQDDESALAFSMEGRQSNLPPALQPGIWSPGWNSNEAINKFQDEIGGHLKGGDPGIRLLDKATAGTQSGWFDSIPQKSMPGSQGYRLVPLHHIFGSEEFSSGSNAIAQRSPKPYAALCAADASALEVDQQGWLKVELNSGQWTLSVAVDDSLPRGVLGLPSGLTGLGGLQGAAYGGSASISKTQSPVIASDQTSGGGE